MVRVDPEDPETQLQYRSHPAEALVFPTHDEMLLWYGIFPESIPKQLADIAQASAVSYRQSHKQSQEYHAVRKCWMLMPNPFQDLSGRTLRRLPAISLVLHTRGATCSIQEALAALMKGVNEEVKAKGEATEGMKM